MSKREKKPADLMIWHESMISHQSERNIVNRFISFCIQLFLPFNTNSNSLYSQSHKYICTDTNYICGSGWYISIDTVMAKLKYSLLSEAGRKMDYWCNILGNAWTFWNKFLQGILVILTIKGIWLLQLSIILLNNMNENLTIL